MRTAETELWTFSLEVGVRRKLRKVSAVEYHFVLTQDMEGPDRGGLLVVL